MVAYKGPETLSSAQELSSLISAVQDDKHGFDKVDQFRAQFQKHQAQPDSNQARATAVKYLRHFARVHTATDLREELTKAQWCESFKEVCVELEAGISLEIPRMPFRGDETHDLICKVVRNLQLTVEDKEGFRAMFDCFFDQGVNICQFEQAEQLKLWKTKFEERGGYLLKQDMEAFFLEREVLDPTRATSNLAHSELFGRLNFPSGRKKASNNPGGWWGLPKKDWSGPDAETRKRALQAIAWIFFSQVSTIVKSWTNFHPNFAVVACNVPELKNGGSIRPKALWVADRSLYFRRVSPDTVYTAQAKKRRC